MIMNVSIRKNIFCVAWVFARLREVFIFTFLLTCIPLWASSPPMISIIQPYQVTSPNGKWIFDVKPSNRKAVGPAATTLTNVETGEIAWKRTLPYTFWQCCVNDRGVVGGFAYTKGVNGDYSSQDTGDFLVAFLDSEGVKMHEERSKRGPYFPSPNGFSDVVAHRLLLDAANDRMILQVRRGVIRCYNMQNGELQAAFLPEAKGDASGYAWPDEIRFIPRSNLILLQSNFSGGGGTKMTTKSCIQIIDEMGRTLWASSQNRTYKDDQYGAFQEFRILEVGELPGGGFDGDPFAESTEPAEPTKIGYFKVYFGNTREKVVFHILDTGGSDGLPCYQFVEVSRKKWTLPKEFSADDEPPPPAKFPVMAAKKLASFQLKRADGSSLTDIVTSVLGPDEKIHVLDSAKGLIHVYDREGKFLHVCDPGKKHILEKSHFSNSITVNEKGVVIARISDAWVKNEEEKDPIAGYFLQFSPDGALAGKPLAPPWEIYSCNVTFQPKANHLVYYGGEDDVVAVTRLDEYGSRVATIAHRPDGQWFEYIEEVVCAPNGMIAVHDSSLGTNTPCPRMPSKLPAETINLYTSDGEPIRTIDFSPYHGLTNFAFDGNLIAATFPWEPPTPLVYIFDAEGKPKGAIRIADLANKENVDLKPFFVSGGKEILAVDQASGQVFRYAIP